MSKFKKETEAFDVDIFLVKQINKQNNTRAMSPEISRRLAELVHFKLYLLFFHFSFLSYFFSLVFGFDL